MLCGVVGLLSSFAGAPLGTGSSLEKIHTGTYVRTYRWTYNINPMPIDLMSVAELRASLADVLARLERRERPLYVTQRGQARAVLIPVKKFEAMLEHIEWLDDSIEALKAKIERYEGKPMKARTWDEVKRDLKRRGRLPA